MVIVHLVVQVVSLLLILNLLLMVEEQDHTIPLVLVDQHLVVLQMLQVVMVPQVNQLALVVMEVHQQLQVVVQVDLEMTRVV